MVTKYFRFDTLLEACRLFDPDLSERVFQERLDRLLASGHILKGVYENEELYQARVGMVWKDVFHEVKEESLQSILVHMVPHTVVLANNIQTQMIEFSAPKDLTNGSRTVYINYMNQKLLLQTPLMSIPYGVGYFNNQKDPKTGELPAIKKYDLNVSFRGMESNPALKNLHDKMQEVEARIKEECFKNRLLWLRDDYDGLKAATDRMFFPIVKYDKDKDTGKVVGKYPPTLKVKLPYDNNTDNFTFECKDMDGNDLNFQDIMKNLKGAKARLMIQLGGLWFVGGRYGCTWKVVNAQFQLKNMSVYECKLARAMEVIVAQHARIQEVEEKTFRLVTRCRTLECELEEALVCIGVSETKREAADARMRALEEELARGGGSGSATSSLSASPCPVAAVRRLTAFSGPAQQGVFQCKFCRQEMRDTPASLQAHGAVCMPFKRFHQRT